MARVLALDISTCTGWSFFDEGQLVAFGKVTLDKEIKEYGHYPWSFVLSTQELTTKIKGLFDKYDPDIVLIEETNKGRNRYSQKVLEFIHCNVLNVLRTRLTTVTKYINTSEWRKVAGVALTSADRAKNKLLAKERASAKRAGRKLDKTAIGDGTIKGKLTTKHAAVRVMNSLYRLTLKTTDNDIADSLGLATAYLRGCKYCNGK
jgi:Holliday junction resolvasome RuvABC endonuclease subunit